MKLAKCHNKAMRLINQMRRLPAPIGEVDDILLSAVQAAAAEAASEGGGEGGPAITSLYDPVRRRLDAYLCALAVRGERAAGEMAGLSWPIVHVLALADPGFGRLVAAARVLYDDHRRSAAVAAVYDRGIDGVEVPVFGRLGDGRDGIIGHRRVYSDRLLQLAVERREAAFKPASAAAKPASVHIGQQVVYNLGGLLDGASVPHKDEAIEIEDA